jgi:hypothetical protein
MADTFRFGEKDAAVFRSDKPWERSFLAWLTTSLFKAIGYLFLLDMVDDDYRVHWFQIF